MKKIGVLLLILVAMNGQEPVEIVNQTLSGLLFENGETGFISYINSTITNSVLKNFNVTRAKYVNTTIEFVQLTNVTLNEEIINTTLNFFTIINTTYVDILFDNIHINHFAYFFIESKEGCSYRGVHYYSTSIINSLYHKNKFEGGTFESVNFIKTSFEGS